VDELDGLTVATDDWWFNVRPSNTEPLLRLNVEARDESMMRAVRDEVLAVVRGEPSPARPDAAPAEPIRSARSEGP
jgi:phosphomannomutase